MCDQPMMLAKVPDNFKWEEIKPGGIITMSPTHIMIIPARKIAMPESYEAM